MKVFGKFFVVVGMMIMVLVTACGCGSNAYKKLESTFATDSSDFRNVRASVLDQIPQCEESERTLATELKELGLIEEVGCVRREDYLYVHFMSGEHTNGLAIIFDDMNEERNAEYVIHYAFSDDSDQRELFTDYFVSNDAMGAERSRDTSFRIPDPDNQVARIILYNLESKKYFVAWQNENVVCDNLLPFDEIDFMVQPTPTWGGQDNFNLKKSNENYTVELTESQILIVSTPDNESVFFGHETTDPITSVTTPAWLLDTASNVVTKIG